MTRQRVAIILGGRSGEHEVSLTSAREVIGALDASRWEAVPIAITRSGDWLPTEDTQEALANAVRSFDTGGAPFTSATQAISDLESCDIAFPLVHGTNGEDGTLQGLLEMLRMPYAGCGVAASAIGMDKSLMKALFHEAGIPSAQYGVIRSWDYADHHFAVSYVNQTTGYPCFVKPANGGSSVGVTKVRSAEDLPSALTSAFAYDEKVIVEESIQGREVECSVLGNERPRASVVGEVCPDREFYDYDSKYSQDSKTDLLIPADLSVPTTERVREMALRTFEVLGCEGYARVDFFVSADEQVLANEINTIPGFTSISMYPKLWEASGLNYRSLLTEILELGMSRHDRRSAR